MCADLIQSFQYFLKDSENKRSPSFGCPLLLVVFIVFPVFFLMYLSGMAASFLNSRSYMQNEHVAHRHHANFGHAQRTQIRATSTGCSNIESHLFAIPSQESMLANHEYDADYVQPYMQYISIYGIRTCVWACREWLNDIMCELWCCHTHTHTHHWQPQRAKQNKIYAHSPMSILAFTI